MMKKSRYLIILTILGFALLPFLVNIITPYFSGFSAAPLPVWLLLLLVAMGILIFVTLKQEGGTKPPEDLSRSPRDRLEFLISVHNNLDSRWKSPQRLPMIPLELNARLLAPRRQNTDTLLPLPNLVHEPRDGLEDPLALGAHVAEIYDKMINGVLVIHGEPGSGKTTLLLSFALKLLERAEHDETKLMPAMFNLSSWAQQRQPIAVWLIEELQRTYHLKRQFGQLLVNTDQIVPLFDGLDELDSITRWECINALREYWKDHKRAVMCSCQQPDFLDSSTQPDNHGVDAVTIQHGVITIKPLGHQQIERTLASMAAQEAQGLREVLRTAPSLLQLVKTPLMFRVLVQAHRRGLVADLLSSQSRETQQSLVFLKYLDHVFDTLLHEDQGEDIQPRYKPFQTIRWLSWLAWQLKRHELSAFSFKRLQPDWLPASWFRWLNFNIGVRWFLGLGCGFLGGNFVGWLISLIYGLPGAGFFTWFSSVILGLVIGIPFALSIEILDNDMDTDLLRDFIKVLERFSENIDAKGMSSSISEALRECTNLVKRRFHSGVLGGLLCGYIIGFILMILRPTDVTGWLFTLSLLIDGVFLLVYKSLASDPDLSLLWNEVQDRRTISIPEEGIVEPIRISCQWGLIIGPILGLLVAIGLIRSTIYEPSLGPFVYLTSGLIGGLIGGIAGGILCGLFYLLIRGWFGCVFGWIVMKLPKNHSYKFRQDIWRSAAQSSFFGLRFGRIIVGVVGGLVGVLVGLFEHFALSIRLPDIVILLSLGQSPQLSNPNATTWIMIIALWFLGGFLSGLFFGVSIGAVLAILFGGEVCLKYMLMLPFLSTGNKYLPWPYTRFLDYAINCGLLRKEGGEYMFIHPQLQSLFFHLYEGGGEASKDWTSEDWRDAFLTLPNMITSRT